MSKQSIVRDERGATVVELAFALPTFIVLVWMMVQLGLVFRANSGIQHALGQGARFATLYPTPNDAAIDTKMNEAVYGIGPGTFRTQVNDVPAQGYKDLTVTYSQPTDFLLFPGPTIHVRKSKRVWIAGGIRDSSGAGAGTTLPTTKTCPDGSVIAVAATCPTTSPTTTPPTTTPPTTTPPTTTPPTTTPPTTTPPTTTPPTTTPPTTTPPTTTPPTTTPSTPSTSPGSSGSAPGRNNTKCNNPNPAKCD